MHHTQGQLFIPHIVLYCQNFGPNLPKMQVSTDQLEMWVFLLVALTNTASK